MAARAERQADLLQNEKRKADENAAGHAEKKISAPGGSTKRNGDEHHDQARPRRGKPAMKFREQPRGVLVREAETLMQIRPQFGQRKVRAARSQQLLGFIEFDGEQNLFRRLREFRHRDLVGERQLHRRCLRAGLDERLGVEENPDAVDPRRAFGHQPPLRTIRQRPGELRRVGHRGRHRIVFPNVPNAVGAGVAEINIGKARFAGGWGSFFDVPVQNFFRPGRATGNDEFIHPKINSGGGEAHDKIRRAQPPQTHAGGAERGELVMFRVVRQRVEQREQQREGQHQDEKFRQLRGGIFDGVEKMQAGLAHMLRFAEEKKRNPEHEETAEAAGQRREQFAEQISVVQPHDAG